MKSFDYGDSLSYEIENFCNINGYKIFYRIIGRGSSDRAILFLHGKGSHSGYLQNITNEALLRKVDFYAFDLTGFGNSSGKRGHIDSFDIYIELIDKFIANKIARAGVKELYLVGESMGSLLGFYYCRNRASSLVKGLVFMPGMFYIEELQKPLARVVLGLLNLIAPRFTIRGKRSIRAYTNNSMFWDLLEDDLLWVREKSIRLISEIDRYLKYMQRELENLAVPILIFQGKDELYRGIGDCIKVFARVSFSAENRIVILNKSNRWLLIDSDLAEIRAVLQNWIE